MTQENKPHIENLPKEQSSEIGKSSAQSIQQPEIAKIFVYWIMFGVITAIFLGLSSIAMWGESVCVIPVFIVYAVLVAVIFSTFWRKRASS